MVDGEPAKDLCEPWDVRCPSLLEMEICATDGQSWKPQSCLAGETCVEELGGCMAQICQPFATECTGDQTYRTCEAAGMDWTKSSCDEDHFCTQGYCVYGPCLGHVLLVVDRSSSMNPHWSTVHESVYKLVSGNDNARFGLMVFPGGEKCEVPEEPVIPLTIHNTAETFDAFFNISQPGMSTPLLEAMTVLEDNHESIFKGQAGVVVVLSDGEDTCEKQTGPLGLTMKLSAKTQALTDAGIRTYVIGYNFKGNTGQLDAIASHGNTDKLQHIPAGSESELDDAFSGIVSDLKLCL
jgi:hypothetical protein